MERRLKEKGIECKYTVENGNLKYSSYSYGGVPIKGQDVGFTAKQLQSQINNITERETKQKIAVQQAR